MYIILQWTFKYIKFDEDLIIFSIKNISLSPERSKNFQIHASKIGGHHRNITNGEKTQFPLL